MLLTSLVFADTGEAVENANGSPVTGTSSFTPTSASGETTVTSTIDATGLGGHTLVFFERLIDSEGKVIVTHEDLTNKDQSIELVSPETPVIETGTTPLTVQSGQALPKTGDHIAIGAVATFIALAMSCAAAVVVSVRRRWDSEVTGNKKSTGR